MEGNVHKYLLQILQRNNELASNLAVMDSLNNNTDHGALSSVFFAFVCSTTHYFGTGGGN